MKYNKFTSLLLIFLLCSPSLFAQDEEHIGKKFGLGISLFNVGEYLERSEPLTPIYLTYDLNDKFRLEPIIGFALTEGFSLYSINIGTFWKTPISKFNFLYGVRTGFSAGNGDRLFVVAPSIAGEYYFIENFSIGSEIQLRVFKPNFGNWVAVTNSSFIIRFYF